MDTEGLTRRLSAILSADVEGYSRLMRDDEEATVRTITVYRTAMAHLIQQYRGRVVDSPGDNILAEFTSVVDAVNCAVEIQRELAERNAELAEDRRMRFRIGINLGDVLEEGKRIYGDGVNIAARMESLAEAGGICISSTVYNAVESKIGLEYEFLGEHEVKNIDKPIRVYRVLSFPGAAAHRVVKARKAVGKTWRKALIATAAVLVVAAAAAVWHVYFRPPPVEPASVEKMAFPLPNKPSIAVLPFDNMSDDPKQEILADGISEEIINALSKLDQVFVVARNSSFTYKGRAVKIQQVAEDLGVRYVLEGSVRKEGDRVRVTAQFIDAVDGHHLFSERYDRQLEGIFALQDEIAIKVLTAVRVELTDGEIARIQARGVSNIDAFFKLLEAYALIQGMNRENNAKARRLAQEALSLEPESSRAYYILAVTHLLDFWLGPPTSRAQSNAQGIEFARKAIEIDPDNAPAHGLLGMLYVQISEYDKAVEAGARGAFLDPNSVTALMYYGSTLMHASRFEEAVPVLQKALRLSPVNPPSQILNNLAFSYQMLGKYDASLELSTRLLQEHPNHLFGHLGLAATYSEMGRLDDARAEAEQVLRLNPKFYLEGFRKTIRLKNPADVDRRFDALRKAGLPETPPLPLPDKPSIAVLAFDNMSGDPEQEYFSDGIAENIITALSKVGQLFVIARNSSFTYKGKPVKIQQVSRELGVRYVLEGSVRRSGDRVRITAQLIDAIKGQHLWAEDYDRDFENILDIQDDITKKIVTALRINLTEGEQARIIEKQYKSLDTYLKGLQWQSFWNKGTEEGHIRAGQLAQEIIDAEPESPVGYRMMSLHHYHLANTGRSIRENAKKAFALSQKALSLDESDPYSHATLGWIYLLMRQYEKAIVSGERSVELAPNMAVANFLLGSTLSYADRIDEGIDYLKRAIRLNPFPAYYYYYHLGRSYWQKGQYEDALAEFKKALQRAPDSPLNHFSLAIALISLDREEEARVSAGRALELLPSMSVAFVSNLTKFKNKDTTNRMLDAMRKAGFPE